MSKFLSIFGKLFGFIPQVVMQIETLAGQQTGTTKKQAALGMITSAVEIAGAVEGVDASIAGTALQTAVSAGIDASVALFNDLGIFKHKNSGSTSPSRTPSPSPTPVTEATKESPIIVVTPQPVHGIPSTL